MRRELQSRLYLSCRSLCPSGRAGHWAVLASVHAIAYGRYLFGLGAE